MFNEVVKRIEWGEGTLELHTGKIARQTDGAVLVKMGETVVLCTTVSSKEVKEDASFFPLTVHYREMAYATGKIPGGFIKREGKATDREVLVARLIDRPIRPLFHPAFFNETQVICTVLSYEAKFNPDMLAIIGASAALALSGVPYQEIIAASRVGLIGEEFILNPSVDELKRSKLDLVVAGTESSVMMVEAEAEFLPEEQVLAAIKFGHQAFQPVVSLIKELVREIGKPKWVVGELFPNQLKEQIVTMKTEQVRAAFAISSKQERGAALKDIAKDLLSYFVTEEHKFTSLQIEAAFEEVKSEIVRSDILEKNIRIDNRKPAEIRKIACEVGILPKTHGSSLFTRGETQVLVVTTLGTSQDEQIVDSLDGEYKERLMLNYIFPPYSVGETTPLRAPGRRETGHGKLAWRAINRLLPAKEEFPYSIRIVAEVTECNGSSSMATVCGSSMALMDAGVPIKTSVAGIAMGLIKLGDKFVVLSDIIGDEDHLGDMDFKVAGSKEGITALQMDIKIAGITFEIMQQAILQAKQGRIHILSEMEKAIITPATEISKYAPAICSFKINKDKIRDVIGAGGKVIREICETTGAKIDIADDGSVFVAAVGKENLEMAVARVKELSSTHAIGDIFNGSVVKILDNGAFINYSANKDGFVHISEIANERIESVSMKLKHGDIVKVKIIGFDNKGKAKLTIKSAETQIQADKQQREEANLSNNEPHNNNENRRKLPKKPINSQNNFIIKERKYFS